MCRRMLLMENDSIWWIVFFPLQLLWKRKCFFFVNYFLGFLSLRCYCSDIFLSFSSENVDFCYEYLFLPKNCVYLLTRWHIGEKPPNLLRSQLKQIEFYSISISRFCLIFRPFPFEYIQQQWRISLKNLYPTESN